MLQINELRKAFVGKRRDSGPVVAVDGVTLEVEQGQFFTLLGPSGCGKTTTLRSVAGLEAPDSGEILLDDRVLFSSAKKVSVAANRRNLGMVFQSYAIWPHMTVLQNVSFPMAVLPRNRRPSRKEMRERVERALATVQLGHLIDRPATDLSGGQQQRLALARALVGEPPLLLLDEPLSNLDAKLRESTRAEIKRLQRELGITAVYVTHDQVEALSMSSIVAVMNEGRVEQVGKPRDVYERPASHFVANFIGTSNFIRGTVKERSGGDYLVTTPQGELRAVSDLHFATGDSVIVSVRPEVIEITQGSAPIPAVGRWGGRMRTRGFLGESVDHLVLVGDAEIQVRCHQSVDIRPGTDVVLTFPEKSCSLVPVGDGGD